MEKESTLKCEACELYNVPILSNSKKRPYTETCLTKKGPPCVCLKENQKTEVDSLRCLRSRTKSQNLDDKIKNLKNELTSLVGEGSKLKAGINNNNYKNDSDAKNIISNSEIKEVHKSHEGNVSCDGGQVEVNPEREVEKETKPTEEFTQWLDSTIDSLSETIDSDDHKDIPDAKDVIVDKVIEGDPDCIITKEYVTPDIIAEELLYESFVVQNHPSYMLGENENVEELAVQPMNLSKRKCERSDEGRHPLAKKTRTTDKKSSHNFKKQRKNKTIQPMSDLEVEVIDIDDDSDNSSPVNNQFDCDNERQEVIVIKDSETTLRRRKSSKKGVWECPICFEQSFGQEVVTTMCGHVFCKKCLEEYHVTFGRSCPTCRTTLSDKPIITLFNF